MAQKELVKGVHVVKSVKDYAHYQQTKIKRYMYVLNDTELKEILMSEEIKELPVAVVSVSGVQRSGKSFLLNYFLRYLSATPSARTDGSWLDAPCEQLTGFRWGSDCDRKNTGIFIWPQPFVIQISSGERVAVLLMDTQSTFDNKSENSTIFALSALLSSTQIYNLMENLNESDLMNLELFASFGALLKADTGKSFQELKFLIRDREDDWDYSYGEDGGESYKEKQFQVTEPEQLAKICNHINNSFENVTCFLMPHPGKHVLKPDYKGNPRELETEFVAALVELVHTIFDSKRLCMKRLDGQPVKSRELYDQFKTYVPMFYSDKLPEPTTIFKGLSDIGLSMSTNETVELFEKNVSRECALSMPAVDLIQLHKEQVELALVSFEGKHFFGDPQDVATKREEIRTELINRLDEMIRTNNDKTNKAVTDGIAAYDAVMLSKAQEIMSCEYACIMKQAHLEALIAACRVFDKNRKIISPDNIDPDRQNLLKTQCEAGLLIVANAAREQFRNNISRECILSMPEEELRKLHDQQLQLALAPFEGEHLFRDATSTYEEIKTDLTKRLDEMLESNKAKLMTAVTNSIAAYDAVIQTAAQDKQSYEYALKLKHAHEEALEAALRVFDENRKKLSSGTIDPDRQSFHKAQCKAGLLMIAKAAREQFENNMSRECALSMPAEELRELHSQQLELALAPFEGQHSFGDQQDVTSKQEEIRMANQLQEYALNLKRAHEVALRAATFVFDENRTKLASGKTDPDRQEFLNAQCEAGLTMLASAVRDQFANNMRRECELSMPAEELLDLHKQQIELALAPFEGEHSFGDQQEVTSRRNTIRSELSRSLGEMYSLNNAKTMETMMNGIAVYDAVIDTLMGEQDTLLGVPLDELEEANQTALTTAMTNVFEANRKTLAAGKTDPDRQEFLEQCDAAFENYKNINMCNHILFSSDALMEYNQYMKSSVFMTRAELHDQHGRAQAAALEKFESMRNRPNPDRDDSFTISLKEDIKTHFIFFKNASTKFKNEDLLHFMRTYYRESMTVAELQNGCLHPDDLQQIHDDAVAGALRVFRPGRPASKGLSEDNPEEQTIKTLIDNHFDMLVDINHLQNERAKVTAFIAYTKKYDQLTSPNIYLADRQEPLVFTSVVSHAHEEAVIVARNTFYEKRRRPRKTHPIDRYYAALEERCLGYKQRQRYRNEQHYLILHGVREF